MLALERIKVPAPNEGQIIDPRLWFDAPLPVELEIGCGKGGFLLHRARATPGVGFVGIEWANKIYEYAADRMARWGLSNVRILRTDARAFVMRHLAPACLSALHLYHPDPWPKKRHHKRRLVQDDFAAAAVRALLPGAEWLVQSDHQEYFDQIRAVLGRAVGLVEISWDEAQCKAAEDWSGTNFEVKYTREGRAIYRAAYRRIA